MAVNPKGGIAFRAHSAFFNVDVDDFETSLAASEPLIKPKPRKLSFAEIKAKGWELSEILAVGNRQNGLNSFGGVTDTGKLVYLTNVVCHASLKYAPFIEWDKVKRNYIKKDLRLFIDYSWGRRIERFDESPAYRAFFDWWLREGPYRRIFIYKDADFVIKNGAWCFTNMPASFVISGVQPLRYINENDNYDHGKIIRAWDQFRRVIDPTEAFIMAHIFQKYGNTYKYNPWQFHVPLTPREWNRDMMQRFVRHAPVLHDDLRPMRAETRYSPLAKCWSTNKNYAPMAKIRDWEPSKEMLQEEVQYDAFGGVVQGTSALPADNIEAWLPSLTNFIIRGKNV